MGGANKVGDGNGGAMGSERGGTETERKQNGPAQSRAPGPKTRDMKPETATETGMETNQNDKRTEKPETQRKRKHNRTEHTRNSFFLL